LDRRINGVVEERGGDLAEELNQIRGGFLARSNMPSAPQVNAMISGEIDQIVGLSSEFIHSPPLKSVETAPPSLAEPLFRWRRYDFNF
jgi:hypothetical protein